MIVDAILGLAVSLVEFVLGLFPSVGWPDWITGTSGASVRGMAASLGGSVSGLGMWIPFDVLVIVLQAAQAVLSAALVIRGARFVLSTVTMGGGD